MSKKFNVVDSVSETIAKMSEEKLKRVPRPGQSMYIIQPFTPDDEDTDVNGKVVKDAIMSYSYAEKMVKASVLSDELDSCMVNGDYRISLDEDEVFKSGKQMIFFNEDDAQDTFKTLMTASFKEAERREEKYANIKAFIQEQVEKNHQ